MSVFPDDIKRFMAETRRTAESAILMLADDDPSKRFLLKAIERRTGIKAPSCLHTVDNSRMGTDYTPPSASVCASKTIINPTYTPYLRSSCARPQSDPGEPQDASSGQPVPQEEIGQPVPSGASQGLLSERCQPAADALVGSR